MKNKQGTTPARGRATVQTRGRRSPGEPASSSSRSRSRSRIRRISEENRAREEAYVEECRVTQERRRILTESLLRSSALDAVTKKSALRKVEEENSIPSSGDFVPPTQSQPSQEQEGDTSVDESVTLASSDSEYQDSQSILPSNQLILQNELEQENRMAASAGRRAEEAGLLEAEENGGNTFKVAARKEQVLLPISAEQMGELLDSKLSHLASRGDLATISNDKSRVTEKVDSITAQVRTNASDITLLRDAVTRLEGGQSGHHEKFRETVATIMREETDHSISGVARPFLAGAKCREQEEVRKKKFERSRRSLRIWPIRGSNSTEISDKLVDFLEGALKLGKDDIAQLGIDSVERTRPSQRSGIYDEVRVTMQETADRDWLAARGRYLAPYRTTEGKPTAGIRLDIPDYLAGDFRTLEDYGLLMKRLHGPSTKKYIKYDDAAFMIYLELRLPGGRSYLKITPSLAKELRESNDREELDLASKELAS